MSKPPASARPLVLQLHDLPYEELDRLRGYLERLLTYAVISIEHFYDEKSGGFVHRVDPHRATTPGDFSKASTATCLAFLKRSGSFADGPWADKADALCHSIIDSDWTTADLPADNPFTAPFLLESIFLLAESGLRVEDEMKITQRLDTLREQLREGQGGLGIGGYSPTAFLTHKAVRSLLMWDSLEPALAALVAEWAWNHLQDECVLVAADSPDADVFEVAYSVILANQVAPMDTMTPQQRQLLAFGLSQFFVRQNPSTGVWPRSRPLFHYPKLGDAHCFDYELLVPLLEARQLLPLVMSHLKSLARAAEVLDTTKFPLSGGGLGWASGHHGQAHLPESWSTASVFHYCFELHRVVAEAIRRSVFDDVGSEYVSPGAAGWDPSPTLGDFLDAPTSLDDKDSSLRKAVEQDFIAPLLAHRTAVMEGNPFPADTAVLAILYGPPGTSKTRLAQQIADCLAWPLLSIDPSHLTRKGLDAIHAEANHLFSMLESCEQIVVFMDEFDELVRSRLGDQGELESRFLTTAMLPKLAHLSERRRIVYLLATNHLEAFDLAIRRPGRFDKIYSVLPPSYAAKIAHWEIIGAQVGTVNDTVAAELEGLIADLTYAETGTLAKRLEIEGVDVAATVREVHELSTLEQPIDGLKGKKWKDQLVAESQRTRRL